MGWGSAFGATAATRPPATVAGISAAVHSFAVTAPPQVSAHRRATAGPLFEAISQRSIGSPPAKAASFERIVSRARCSSCRTAPSVAPNSVAISS